MAEIKPVEIPSPMQGVKAYKFGRCKVIVDRRSGYWHLSISHHRQLPSWQELRDARYALIPDEVTMAMLLPPKSEYVNIHEYCFHLHEVEGGNKNNAKILGEGIV
jgi:hypothetical protein